jgi:hypothetical protein
MLVRTIDIALAPRPTVYGALDKAFRVTGQVWDREGRQFCIQNGAR